MNNKKWKEVKVGFAGDIDGDLLPIKCLCGYGGYWDFTISIYQDDPNSCPKCGRKYYFKYSTNVFVLENNIEKVK